MKKGSLVCIGTGLHLGQATLEAQRAIEEADEVLYVVPETDTVAWIKKLNPNADTLVRHYKKGKPRRETYDEMTETILAPVREGKKVCVAFYGHPGLFVNASHAAIKIARAEGHEAYSQSFQSCRGDTGNGKEAIWKRKDFGRTRLRSC